jgi:hypothetical protein
VAGDVGVAWGVCGVGEKGDSGVVEKVLDIYGVIC